MLAGFVARQRCLGLGSRWPVALPWSTLLPPRSSSSSSSSNQHHPDLASLFGAQDAQRTIGPNWGSPPGHEWGSQTIGSCESHQTGAEHGGMLSAGMLHEDELGDSATSQQKRAEAKKAHINRLKERGFVDLRRVLVRGGRGGLGCFSHHREPYTRKKRADGADGGRGGNVIFVASSSCGSLEHIPSTVVGHSGGNGGSNLKLGGNARPRHVDLPLGTVIQSIDGEVLADLTKPGQQFEAAIGGRGGRGNTGGLKSTRSSDFDDPRKTGAVGSSDRLVLELKTLADVGLVGMPNAGKSTFASAVSNAHPKIAAYPFTTLNPHLGVIDFEDFYRMRVADIPGILPNAHLNKGLGHKFLRHIERNSVLLFIIDASAGQDSIAPTDAYHTLRKELEMYNQSLMDRPILVAASKMDLPGAEKGFAALHQLLHPRIPVLPFSGKTGEGVREVTSALREQVEQEKTKRQSSSERQEAEDKEFEAFLLTRK